MEVDSKGSKTGTKEEKTSLSIDNFRKEWSDLDILHFLGCERKKFTQRDEELMDYLIGELQLRGIYPRETVEGNPNSVRDMVNGWGETWYKWSGPLDCQNCGSDLRDHVAGPPFKREIGHIAMDRCTFFSCPDCKGRV